jgi:S-adenosylmethionine/arginine decarboxylase-like enzyme
MHDLNLFHLHMVGKAYIKNPPTTVEAINDWLIDLVEKIQMKILIGPFSVDCKTLGNEGITGALVIETSHLSGHCWHLVDRPFLMWDVYSCVVYDPEVVLQTIHTHFDLEQCNYALIDRNDVPYVVKSGSWTPE